VWTAPLVQGVGEGKSDLVRLRACVRPAERGARPLAQMGFRDPPPNGLATLLAGTLRGFCGSSDRPIQHLFLPALAPAAMTSGSAGLRH
jgi:hypothetical protein